MAKKLIINCASCDARKIREENYAHYESITVNCADMLTNPQGKAVMSKLTFTLNCANVLETEEDVEVRVINGSGEIRSSDTVPETKYYMRVNGSLTIGPGTQKHLEKCVGMTVNGSLICPESVYPCLTGVKINGSSSCYPDGAILLKPNAVIDKLFALRAKPSLYWSRKRMIMVDPELDGEVLKAKGASFCSKEVIIAQSKVEAMIELIDEKADIVIVPDGTSVILDDVTLDDAVLRRHGKKLYVIGDVTVPEEGDALDALEYLNVRGDARVPKERRDRLLEILTAISGKVEIARPKGATLNDKPLVKITKWMLEQQPMGVVVEDCVVVKIADDIPKELILERLHIQDCAVVKCSEEQEDSVAMICEDVGKIGNGDDENDSGIGGAIKSTLGGILNDPDTKVINAADYVL